MTCSPGLGTGTVVSKPANWSAFDCSSSGGFLYQVNDLSEIRPGESESVVMHFVVSDVSAPASITVTSEYRDTPGTTASTDVAPMTVRSTALPNGRIGTPYAFRVETSRFTPSTFTATGLDAAGLSLDPASGSIFGTPTTRGSYPVTIVAHSSSGGPDASGTFVLRVVAGNPSITSASLATAVRSPFSFTIPATREPAAQFQVTAGRLPAGITLDKTTGVLSGTPTKAGYYHFVVTVANEGGTASAPFDLEVTGNSKPDEI